MLEDEEVGGSEHSENEGEPDEQTQSLYDKLAHLVIEDNVDALRTKLDEEGLDVNIKSEAGWTLLMQAAEYGSKKCIALLLSREGVDATAKPEGCEYKYTALERAAHNNHIECARLLLEYEDGLLLKDDSGAMALRQAFDGGIFDGSDDSPEKMVDLLLAHGADLEKKDSAGNTSLLYVLIPDHPYSAIDIEAVEFLLNKNVNVNAKTLNGTTPLIVATLIVGNTGLKAMHALLAHGADVNISASNGWNPLKIAIDREYIDGIKLLLAHGADYRDSEASEAVRPIIEKAASIDSDEAFSHEARNIVKAIVFSYDWDNDAEYDLCFDEAKIKVGAFLDLPQEIRNIVKAIVFSYDWGDDAEYDLCFDEAKSTAEAFLAKIQHLNKTTKTFISEHYLLIDEFLQQNKSFKEWDLDKINPMKALVNFAFLHGDKVSGIYELYDKPIELIKAFLSSVPLDHKGDVLEYSFGECFTSKDIAKDPASQLFKKTDATHLWNKITSFLGKDNIANNDRAKAAGINNDMDKMEDDSASTFKRDLESAAEEGQPAKRTKTEEVSEEENQEHDLNLSNIEAFVNSMGESGLDDLDAF
jgi:ankyrin repeat protein